MRLEDVARSMMKPFRTDDGRRFYGEFIKPESRTPPDNFDAPRRLLRTGDQSCVGIGDVMLDTAGRHYLLADHDDTDTPRLHVRMFRLFDVDKYVTWGRPVKRKDAVTGLARDDFVESLGGFWCSVEQPASFSDGAIRVKQMRYRVVTGAQLQLGDRISDGALKVITVVQQLGVTFAEVE